MCKCEFRGLDHDEDLFTVMIYHTNGSNTLGICLFFSNIPFIMGISWIPDVAVETGVTNKFSVDELVLELYHFFFHRD